MERCVSLCVLAGCSLNFHLNEFGDFVCNVLSEYTTEALAGTKLCDKPSYNIHPELLMILSIRLCSSITVV